MIDTAANEKMTDEPDDANGAQESRRKKRRPASIRIAALNITSFLDMSFCLLTFLILSASLAPPEGVLAAKLPADPPSETGGQPPEKELRVTISSYAGGCRIAVDGMPAATPDFKSLTAQLAQWRLSERNPAGIYRADNPVVIVAANDCDWQQMVNALNAVIAARFSDVSFRSGR